METFLKAEGLIKRYGQVQALRGVDLDVRPGDSFVILGPNGAGKSTLLGVLAGRIKPTEGKVTFHGEILAKNARARALTGYLGHPSLMYKGLTARENLMFYADLYGIGGAAGRSDEMLRFMGLWERRNDRVGGFSRGMEQRLSIARSLLHDPQIILLDEPFSGLDGPSSRALTTALGQLRDGKRALLLATHDIAVTGDLGESVVIMDRGRILHQAPVPAGGSDRLGNLYSTVLQGDRR